MSHRPANSYLICATPRTGSTLLCTMLKASGVAGQPESYFRKPDETYWAQQWGIVYPHNGAFTFAGYLEAASVAGRSKNGVFAARIMWGSMEEVIANLTALYPDVEGTDRDLLARAFGPTRFVYLRRADVIAQAVSHLPAEQTDVWQLSEDSDPVRPLQEPQYDFEAIHGLIPKDTDNDPFHRSDFTRLQDAGCAAVFIHRKQPATRQAGKSTRPSVGHIAAPQDQIGAALRRLPDGAPSRCATRLPGRGDLRP